MKWTFSLHREALDELFTNEWIRLVCRSCPVSPVSTVYKNRCNICREYIGITREEIESPWKPAEAPCPCYILGPFEAMKRTHLKLEEDGVW